MQMNAVYINAYGGGDALSYGKVDVPTPAPDQVLVNIKATAVNPVDWKIREGYLSQVLNSSFPLILGCEFAGVVTAVGSSVNRFKQGDEVFGFINLLRCGAYAEYLAANESEVALKPANLEFRAAAAIPVGALTAYQSMVGVAGLSAGQTVLIQGAAGGVGSLAVQLAHALGFKVIATASSRNTDFVTSLGADIVVDYTSQRFEDFAKGVDAVFDLVGGEAQTRSFSVLRKGGALVSAVSPPSGELAESFGVKAQMIQVQPDGPRLDQIRDLVEQGKIRTFVERNLPMSSAKEALDLSQGGRTRGKIVLDPAN